MTYIDSNIVIRLFASDRGRAAPLWSRIAGVPLVTSMLTRLECRVLPVKVQDQPLLQALETFFARITLHPIDEAVLDVACELRARSRARTPDAIHVATARLLNVDAFLTADRRLKQFSDLPIETL